MTRPELIDAIGRICQKLGSTLSTEEIEKGWNERIREHFLELFRSLETNLRNGVDIPHTPIARVLDHFGIDEGDLFEEACQIDVALNLRQW
jgi:hypothetical protein